MSSGKINDLSIYADSLQHQKVNCFLDTWFSVNKINLLPGSNCKLANSACFKSLDKSVVWHQNTISCRNNVVNLLFLAKVKVEGTHIFACDSSREFLINSHYNLSLNFTQEETETQRMKVACLGSAIKQLNRDQATTFSLHADRMFLKI